MTPGRSVGASRKGRIPQRRTDQTKRASYLTPSPRQHVVHQVDQHFIHVDDVVGAVEKLHDQIVMLLSTARRHRLSPTEQSTQMFLVFAIETHFVRPRNDHCVLENSFHVSTK